MADDVTEMFMQLQDMTRRTGILYGPQVEQLKLWGRVVMPNVTDSVVKVSIEKRVVEYELTTKGRSPGNTAKRLEVLGAWVQTMLGQDWLVRVKAKGKTLHTTKRKKNGKPTSKSGGVNG